MSIDEERFGGITRLYGKQGAAALAASHVCIVGLGGVGSWLVEALARNAIGELTLIDYDTISTSNINRQLPALSETLGQKKHAVLAERVASINPQCQVNVIDDFLTMDNLRDLIHPGREYSYVVDAIDSIRFKAGLIYCCKRSRIPVITTGAAGGLTDPLMIKVKDLNRTWNDPLAAKVRKVLRDDYGFTRNPKRYFGIECVFSSQQQVYPKEDGTVSHEKPGIHGVHLDCRFGYGAAAQVTGTFGFVAASRVVNRLVKKATR